MTNSPAVIAELRPPTVREHEAGIQQLLHRLAHTSEPASNSEAQTLLSELRACLAPKGFHATVQLEEDGRRKRGTAPATSWNFASGEIVIYYEPVEEQSRGATVSGSPAAPVTPMPQSTSSGPSQLDLAAEIRECCEALDQAESAGMLFVSFKWFRDLALAGQKFAWAQTMDGRHRVLSAAIECGAIHTRKIPNPKSPLHPTTTVALNRKSSPVKMQSRFKPIPITGAPLSETILKDRG